MSRNLRTLSRQERFYSDTLANLKQFMANFEVERDSGQLEGWKQRVNNLYNDFQANRLQIEMLTDEADAKEEDVKVADEASRFIRREFENDYVRVSSFLTMELQKLHIRSQSLPGPALVPLPLIILFLA